MQNFDPKTVVLEGVNLVEASAGTGKTYSVAVLALRLIIEKNIPIHRILMVTFTNAAVAEMAHRIRKFLRLGVQAASGIAIDEPTIRGYIQEKIGEVGQEEIIKRLNTALIGLDESSIQTIHSFCQDSLQLFAFETGQAYGLKLQEDLSELISIHVEDFWRNEITGLSVAFLSEMRKMISKNTLEIAVQNSLQGKEFDGENDFELNHEDFQEAKHRMEEEFEEYQTNFLRQVEAKSTSGHYKEKAKNELLDQIRTGPLELGQWLAGTQQYKESIREEIFPEFFIAYQAFIQSRYSSLKGLIQHCIESVKQNILQHLERNHLITYDAMITKLHKSVQESEVLRSKLSERYDAVFIDEFQDTDKLQFEIYDGLFSQNKILFYIGDPKQSIYGWRKADLNTYFKASQKEGVNRYTMKSNFRSTTGLLDAMNTFFDIENPFLSEHIYYQEVNSGINEQRRGLVFEDKSLEPIQVFRTATKGEIPDKVLSLLGRLLKEDVQINGKRLKPSDIAILVRTKGEGKEIKRILARKGIPAVNVDETKIFETEEAEYLEYILQTTLEITWKGVNKALLNKFTGWKAEDLVGKDSDRLVSKFKEYQMLWADLGVYAMIRKYMQDFGVINHLLNPENPTGKRIYSNITQLMEVLQEAEYRKELRPSGLLSFLQKQRRKEAIGDGTTYLQRLEDDQDAITIMTIHKSKGLEFPLVIAPYLNLDDKEKFDFSSYRDTEGDYRFYHNDLGSDEEASSAYRAQANEENRRLLYVAVTRAVYQCFLFARNREPGNTLPPFIRQSEGKIFIYEVNEFPYAEVTGKLGQGVGVSEMRNASLPDIALSDQNWRKLSFSYLTRKAKPIPKPMSKEQADPYEEFIFRKLPRGASVGDLLHFVFERIDFQEQTAWKPIVEKAIGKYYPQFGEDMIAHLLELVNQVATVSIPQVATGFSLSDISRDKKITEWEFDMSSASFEPGQLMDVPLPDGFLIRSVEGRALQGILNGLVDLIFEYEGKFYILDWKSNFLGDSLEDYHNKGLLESMNDNNYHLQYLLYSLALKQYLENYQEGFEFERDFGGVIYVFLRGIRKGKSTGIFHYLPRHSQLEFLEKLMVERVGE